LIVNVVLIQLGIALLIEVTEKHVATSIEFKSDIGNRAAGDTIPIFTTKSGVQLLSKSTNFFLPLGG